MKKKLLFVTNVDWYFQLHWKDRVFSEMTDNFEVTVCYSITEKDAETGDNLPQIKPICISRSSIGFVSNFISLIQAWKIFVDGGYDLIHSVTVKPNIFFGLIALLKSCPIVITIPGLGTVFSSNNLHFTIFRKIILSLYRIIGKNGKAYFVFENMNDRKIFCELKICSNQNSVVVNGAGVNVTEFSYSLDAEIDTKPIKVLFAGRLLKGKGLDDLVKAVDLLRNKGEKVELLVAGITDNDSSESLSEDLICKWHHEKKLTFLGQIDDMAELISSVQIVVLPSKYGEGLPRILLEANACGRPVIATDIPGCNDFIQNGENGILVTPGKIEELAEAICTLMSPDQRRRMGKNGREIVEASYTNEAVASSYKRIYQRIA